MGTYVITHTGTVVGRSGRSVSVRLNLKADGGDCGACALSSVCRPDGSKAPDSQLTVDATVPDGVPLPAVGTTVELTSRPHGTAEATMALLVVPLLVFLIIAVGCTLANVNQAVGGICAIGGAILVYPVMYLIRRKRDKKLWLVVAPTDSKTM